VAFILDRKYDIVARSGLHCAPLAHQTAGTIEKGALRFSLNYFQNESDIQALLNALAAIS
jgi:selenocysteine lyase/cysteine desulfurase